MIRTFVTRFTCAYGLRIGCCKGIPPHTPACPSVLQIFPCPWQCICITAAHATAFTAAIVRRYLRPLISANPPAHVPPTIPGPHLSPSCFLAHSCPVWAGYRTFALDRKKLLAAYISLSCVWSQQSISKPEYFCDPMKNTLFVTASNDCMFC